MAPPASATPLSFNVLLASTWTAPLSVIVVPVTVVPSSVSVLPASTVSWPLLTAAPSIVLLPVTCIVPLSVTVPPVTLALSSVSVAVPSTATVPPCCLSALLATDVGWPLANPSLLIYLSPVISILPASTLFPTATPFRSSFNVLLASTWTVPVSVIEPPVIVVPSSVRTWPLST